MKPNVHDGHRGRLRDKIRKEGLGKLLPHEVLEYYLYAFVPRRDTNALAHRLLQKFGSIAGVLDADLDALMEIDGMTANAALFFNQLPSLLVMYKMDKALASTNFLRPETAVGYLNELIGNRPVECCAALAVDGKGTLLGTIQFDSGRRDAVDVDTRRLVKELLRTRASGVIVAHNHPSGDVSPSKDDLDTYQMLRQALEPLHITLLDCLVVGGGRAYSLLNAASGDGCAPSTKEGDPLPNSDEYNLLFNRNDKK